jgi:hypothetical protein
MVTLICMENWAPSNGACSNEQKAMDTPFTSDVFTMSTVHVDVPEFCNSGFLPNERKLLPSTQIGLAFIQ